MTWLHSNIQEVKNPKNMTANKKHPNNSITICKHDHPCSYTSLLSMQYNNIDSHYIHINEKYRHQVISLLPVLSEKYTRVHFSLRLHMKLFYNLLFIKQ